VLALNWRSQTEAEAEACGARANPYWYCQLLQERGETIVLALNWRSQTEAEACGARANPYW